MLSFVASKNINLSYLRHVSFIASSPGFFVGNPGKNQLSFDLPRELCPRSGLVASLHKASIWQQIWQPRHKWGQTIF